MLYWLFYYHFLYDVILTWVSETRSFTDAALRHTNNASCATWHWLPVMTHLTMWLLHCITRNSPGTQGWRDANPFRVVDTNPRSRRLLDTTVFLKVMTPLFIYLSTVPSKIHRRKYFFQEDKQKVFMKHLHRFVGH